jgi:hypothetical protein
MGKFLGTLTGIVLFLAIIAGSLYGYVSNIISLVSQNESMGMIIGRAIGIFFAPLGIVLGYF